jgi:hypothetical protein
MSVYWIAARDALAGLLISAPVNGATAGTDPVARPTHRMVLRDDNRLFGPVIQVASVDRAPTWSDPATMMKLRVAFSGDSSLCWDGGNGKVMCRAFLFVSGCACGCSDDTDQPERDEYRFSVMHFRFSIVSGEPSNLIMRSVSLAAKRNIFCALSENYADD